MYVIDAGTRKVTLGTKSFRSFDEHRARRDIIETARRGGFGGTRLSGVDVGQERVSVHRADREVTGRLPLLRLIVVTTVVLGLNYIVWRWFYSLNWRAWWIAVPLVVAETYSLIDVTLFGLTMWRARARPLPPVAPDGLTVDVFITTFNEPVDLVIETATAARAIPLADMQWLCRRLLKFVQTTSENDTRLEENRSRVSRNLRSS